MLPHPSGTIAALIGCSVLVLAAGVGAWMWMRPCAMQKSRPFSRLTVVGFAALDANLRA